MKKNSILAAWLLLLAIASMAGCSSRHLEPWHSADLSTEFDARMVDEVRSFEDYVALEARLFGELVEEVYDEVGTGPEFDLVRYSAGSAADPNTRQPDYNRTFVLHTDAPRGGILLLHGMSDSPYSLREIGEKLHEQGYCVIGLRLPGHGTAPSGIKSVRWQDMAAATRLAMEHLGESVSGKPLHIFGYSNGAALALNYTLDAMDNVRTGGSGLEPDRRARYGGVCQQVVSVDSCAGRRTARHRAGGRHCGRLVNGGGVYLAHHRSGLVSHARNRRCTVCRWSTG